MVDQQRRGAVLITGTSTGIGRTTALYLDKLGFEVYATVRQERDAELLRSVGSERLKPILLDVRDEEAIALARDKVGRAVGDRGLAALVNNAGVGFASPLEFVPLDEVRWLFEVNLFGLLAVTQAFLPLLRQARGRIVNISSTASYMVAPFHGPYSASKLGVNGLSDALRLELRPWGIQVSVVVCGSIHTPIWEKGTGLVDRVTKDFPPEAWELYGPRFRVLQAYFARIGRAGISPEVVSRAIAHALTARRARHTYLVGPDAHLYSIADKLLYGRLRDWVILRATGLSDRA